MNDLIDNIIANPELYRCSLLSSLKRFIKVFHYYLYHKPFVFKPFHDVIINKLEEEIDECTMGVTIPSDEGFASLNLSHAVQIISYQLFRTQNKQPNGIQPVTLGRLEKTVETIADNLQKIGFFKITGRDDMTKFWRDVLSRAALSEGEAAYIEQTFNKAAGLAGKNRQ